MTTTPECPICNEKLEAGQTQCPRCGFKLIGQTQAFKPVVVPTGEVPVVKTNSVPALQVQKGPYAGESFVMGKGTFSIGRDPKCDLFLSNMTVSRHHATITIDDNGAHIVDEGSLNGTWIDGKVADKADLVPGSRVQIGNFDMVYKLVEE